LFIIQLSALINTDEVKLLQVDQVHVLMNSMADGRKIDAIKAHRSLTGDGLKESKDAVDAVMNYVAPAY
jgi:ribosomal protein L7/L12